MKRTDPKDALGDLCVLQSGRGKAAAFCAKLLADLGAHVTSVAEPPGEGVGADGPFHPSDGQRRWGGLSLYLNVDKQVLRVDETDREGFAELMSTMDVLIEDETSESLRSFETDDDGLIRCSITPFGVTGPHSAFAASHLNLFHAGCESPVVPLPGVGWPPLQLASDIACFDIGSHAAVAVVAAATARRATGLGERIDISGQDVLVSENRATMLRYLHDDMLFDYNTPGYANSLYPTADGYVMISFGVQERSVKALAESTEGEAFSDPMFADGGWRVAPVRETFVRRLTAWCQERTTQKVVEIFEGVGWPIGPVNTAGDLLGSEQLASREYFRWVDHPTAGRVRVPGPPFHYFSCSKATRTGAIRVDAPPVKRPPLQGIRVLDFTWAAAGPYATYLLAHLGAEVLKVEHVSRPDSTRRGFQTPPPHLLVEGPWPYGSMESSPNFGDLAASKRSVTLDLSHPRALEVVKRLLPLCDVVTSNFRPGVMDKLGLGATTLLEERSDLIVAEVSACGSSGPERRRPGYANIFAATGGLSDQTGFGDGPPTEAGDAVDFRCGSAFALAIVGALALRQQTGQGQFVDVACQEVIAAFAPNALLGCVLDAPHVGRLGNHHPRFAPHNVYPAAGTRRWLSLAVETDEEWESLCQVLGRPDLARSHGTATLRKADERNIDSIVGRWSQTHDPFQAAKLLQQRGVRAMPCMSNRDLANSEHLAAREMFVALNHPVMGEQTVLRPPWLVDPGYRPPHLPAPLLGEANDYVLDELLGVTGELRERLFEAMA